MVLDNLQAFRAWLHQEATAEHNANDARAAFAIARDRFDAEVLDPLRSQESHDLYVQADLEVDGTIVDAKPAPGGRGVLLTIARALKS